MTYILFLGFAHCSTTFSECFSIKLLRMLQPSLPRGYTKLLFSLFLSYFFLILLDLNPRDILRPICLVYLYCCTVVSQGLAFLVLNFLVEVCRHHLHLPALCILCSEGASIPGVINLSLSEKKTSAASSHQCRGFSTGLVNSHLFYILTFFFLSYLFS